MNYSEALQIQLTWDNGDIIEGRDLTLWRRDAFGSLIHRRRYGDHDSQYGWEIDHLQPIVLGGAESLANYRPLHWRNSAAGALRTRLRLVR